LSSPRSSGGGYEALDAKEQEAIAFVVGLLEAQGVALGTPYSSAVRGSRLGMRELRKQYAGRAYRILYVFDTKRQAVLLVAGDKAGRPRSYAEMVPRAEAAYAEYLKELGEKDKD